MGNRSACREIIEENAGQSGQEITMAWIGVADKNGGGGQVGAVTQNRKASLTDLGEEPMINQS